MKFITRLVVLLILIAGGLLGLHAARGGFAPGPYFIEMIPRGEEAVLLHDLGLEFARFEIHAPPGHKVTIWQEAYRGGKRVDELCFGQDVIPRPDEAVNRRFRWTRYRQPDLGPNGEQQLKWEFSFENSSMRRWEPDLFEETDLRSTKPAGRISLASGPQTYLIWSMIGWHNPVGKNLLEPKSGYEDWARQRDAALLLKVRVEPVDPQRDAPAEGAIGEIPEEAR